MSFLKNVRAERRLKREIRNEAWEYFRDRGTIQGMFDHLEAEFKTGNSQFDPGILAIIRMVVELMSLFFSSDQPEAMPEDFNEAGPSHFVPVPGHEAGGSRVFRNA